MRHRQKKSLLQRTIGPWIDGFRLVFGPDGREARVRVFQICVVGTVTWTLSGFGFLWIEPTVNTWWDGLWLAFTSGATVGYGDLVPTTVPSRLFAILMVLIGFGLLSVVTAVASALLLGEEERRMRIEMHQDLRALRGELAALRRELAVATGHTSLTHAGSQGDNHGPLHAHGHGHGHHEQDSRPPHAGTSGDAAPLHPTPSGSRAAHAEHGAA